MTICPLIVHFVTQRVLDERRGVWIRVRRKDAQKQLARTPKAIL